ncbi:MAG: 2-dehydro-3-deoxyglucarate aldolase [Deltaproteobacteria bacterium]|nr:2-dehydro-3-deoxyglucarate aldolase [Deltaproteobacteria bacterium]
MQFIRDRVLKGEVMFGIGAFLGCGLTVEMIGAAGFDWTWIDCEHGAQDYSELIHQMQANSIYRAPAVVRIAWNEAPRFKRVLDLGAAGIMVPYVNTAEEAELAAEAMRYPPDGVRGVAKFNRACGFGQNFSDYFSKANENLLTVVQVETRKGVENADEIAAVDGVDVLFIGPLDLSVSLGVADNYEHPEFLESMDRVAEACKRHGKAAGILVPRLDYLESWIAKGFTFLVVGSDGGCVANGLKNIAAVCGQHKKKEAS